MSGIYIHIPFCKSKCSYCDFYSVANSKKVANLISALLKEIEIRKEHLSDKNIKTIYFGGGTPSQLDIKDIEIILNELNKHYQIQSTAEITFEANPDDLRMTYLQALKSIGVNRLSIGLQSLDNDMLKFLRRRHTAEDAIKAVENANKCGFENISVDLIYGIPGLSEKMWQNTLYKTFKLPIEHLSAYHLGFEENTLIYRQLKENKFQIIDEELSYRQYCNLLKTSSSYGINQYEISNFAKKGYKSKHNSSYWQQTEYLGFGPSAHSHYQNQRAFNVSDINLYCKKIIRSEEHYQTEILSITNQMNETIMLSLRTVEGLNIKGFEKDFGVKEANRLKLMINSLENSNYKLENGFLRLTPKGMFVSDSIILVVFV